MMVKFDGFTKFYGIWFAYLAITDFFNLALGFVTIKKEKT
jgi:hypothetical protein